ncbi:hypothetical protein [Klebsiella pneumoniae]|jgi:hypothetical protein|uniref:hypothetical protein n=1 Tax=Klebsiella pneumoniae TaxID=573 RepID=UPI0020D25865|nr:hypothetical protein [Klebsiella pneumoniae]
MLNTDSLAWQWHIPELARQIYPWVSWLYREYYGLAGAFLVIGLFFGLAELWAGRMRFVGLSHKERREYADRYKRDNDRAAPFSVLASLDSPGRMVRARRHVWNYAYWLTGAAGLVLLGGWLSPCLSRAGEKRCCVRATTRMPIITCCNPLICSG